MNKQVFSIPLGGEGEGRKVFKLPSGHYEYTWTVELSGQIYPAGGAGYFKVTVVPHYFDFKSSRNFHGGIKLLGY